MNDLTRVNEIQEKILTAIGIVNGSFLNSLSYDKTVVGTILDDSNREEGFYEVSDGELIFTAISSSTSYRAGNKVYVTIPSGNYENQKIIIGKVASNEEKPVEIIKPFDTFFSMTDNLVKENKQYQFTTGTEVGSYKIDLNTTMDIVKFSRVGIKAKFKSYFTNCIEGNYGLALTLSLDDENKEPVVLKLDSSEMNGNPYNFTTFYEQEIVFDISEYSDKIKSIELHFYHTGDFKDNNGKAYSSLIDNLFVKDIELHFGYDTNIFTKDLVELYTLDNQVYENNQNNLTREIRMRWVHLENGKPVNMKNLEDENIDIRFYRYKIGASAADIYCGTYWEKLDVTPVKDQTWHWDIELVHTLQQNRIKAIIIKDNIPYFSNELTFDNKEEVNNLTGVYHILNALTIKTDDNLNGNYMFYGQDKKISDTKYSEEVRTLSAWFDVNENDILEDNEKIQNVSSENIVWYFPVENTMIKLLNGQSYEKIELKPYEAGKYYCLEGNSYEVATGDFDSTKNYYEKLEDGSYILVTNFYQPGKFYIQNYLNCKDNNIKFDNSMAYYYLDGNKYEKISQLSFSEYDKNKGQYYILTYELDNSTVYDPDKAHYIYTNIGKVENTIPEYRINAVYSQDKNNNIIRCEYTINNITYVASKEFTFGIKGTMGTDQTLVIDFVKNNMHAVSKGKGADNKLQVQLYDDNDELQTSLDDQVKWSWYYNQDMQYYAQIVDKNGKILKTLPSYKTAYFNIDTAMKNLVPSSSNDYTNYFGEDGSNPNQNKLEFDLKTKFPQLIEKEQKEVIDLSTYNFDIDSLYIIQAQVGDLTTYFPVPVTGDGSKYKYLTGPTQVIYNSDGKLYSHNYESYKMFNIEGQQMVGQWHMKFSEPMNIYSSIGLISQYQFDQLKLEENLYYKDKNNEFVLVSKGNSNYNGYNETTFYYQLIEGNFYASLNNDTLIPWNMYIKDAVYGVQFIDDSQNIVWTQPILVLQNNWFSNVINKWDGNTLELDQEAGLIQANAFSAGKKNLDNTFSGVIIGDWSQTNSDESITKQTGIYGVHEGAISYALTEDGKAWFGKEGKGKIELDGDNTTISSSLWSNGNGMQINLGNAEKSPRLTLKANSLDRSGQKALGTEKLLELGFSDGILVDDEDFIEKKWTVKTQSGQEIYSGKENFYQHKVPHHIPNFTKSTEKDNIVEYVLRDGDSLYLRSNDSYTIKPIAGLTSSKINLDTDEVIDDYWTVVSDQNLYNYKLEMQQVEYPAFHKGELKQQDGSGNYNVIIETNEASEIQNNKLPLMQFTNAFVTKDDQYTSDLEASSDNIIDISAPILITEDMYYSHPFIFEDRDRNLYFPDLSEDFKRFNKTSEFCKFFYLYGDDDDLSDDKKTKKFFHKRKFYKNATIKRVPAGQGWWGSENEEFSTYKLHNKVIETNLKYYKGYIQDTGIYDIDYDTQNSVSLDPLVTIYYAYSNATPLEGLGIEMLGQAYGIKELIEDFQYSDNFKELTIVDKTGKEITSLPFINFIPYHILNNLIQEANDVLERGKSRVGKGDYWVGNPCKQNLIELYDWANKAFYDLFFLKNNDGEYLVNDEDIVIPDKTEIIEFINSPSFEDGDTSLKASYWRSYQTASSPQEKNKYALLYAREAELKPCSIEYQNRALPLQVYGGRPVRGDVIIKVVVDTLSGGFYWKYIDNLIGAIDDRNETIDMTFKNYHYKFSNTTGNEEEWGHWSTSIENNKKIYEVNKPLLFTGTSSGTYDCTLPLDYRAYLYPLTYDTEGYIHKFTFTSNGLKKLREYGDFKPNTYYYMPKEDNCVNLILGKDNVLYYNGQALSQEKDIKIIKTMATTEGKIEKEIITLPAGVEFPTDLKNDTRMILVNNNTIDFIAKQKTFSNNTHQNFQTWYRTISRNGPDSYTITWTTNEDNSVIDSSTGIKFGEITGFADFDTTTEKINNLFFQIYKYNGTNFYEIPPGVAKEEDIPLYFTLSNDNYSKVQEGQFNSSITYYSHYAPVLDNSDISVGESYYYKILTDTDETMTYTVELVLGNEEAVIENNLYGQSVSQMTNYFMTLTGRLSTNISTLPPDTIEICQINNDNNNIKQINTTTSLDIINSLEGYDIQENSQIKSMSTEGFRFIEDENHIYFYLPPLQLKVVNYYDFIESYKITDYEIRPPQKKNNYAYIGNVSSNSIVYYKKIIFDSSKKYERNKYYIFDEKENKYVISKTMSALPNIIHYELLYYSENPNDIDANCNPYIHLSLDGSTSVNDKFNYPFLIKNAMSVDWFGNAEFKGIMKAKGGWIGSETSHFDIKTKDRISYLSYNQDKMEGDLDLHRPGEPGFYLSPEEGLGMGQGRVQIASNGLQSKFGGLFIDYLYPNDYEKKIFLSTSKREYASMLPNVKGAATITTGGHTALLLGAKGYDPDMQDSIISAGLVMYPTETKYRKHAITEGGEVKYYPYVEILSYKYDQWYTASDQNLKDNIKPTSSQALDILNKITIESYDWKKSNKHVEMGLVAQHLENIIPELVNQNPLDGLKFIDYEGLIPYCIKAIQELSTELAELKREKGETK